MGDADMKRTVTSSMEQRQRRPPMHKRDYRIFNGTLNMPRAREPCSTGFGFVVGFIGERRG